MRITVHIDRVVLDGVGNPRDADAVGEALRTELSRLVAGTDFRDVRRVTAPDVRVGSVWNPASAGRDIARSIHSGLNEGRGEWPGFPRRRSRFAADSCSGTSPSAGR